MTARLPPPAERIIVVAEVITELKLIRFEPENSICNGNSLGFKRESVPVMRDFLLTFPQISVMEINSSGSTILYLQLAMNFLQRNCLSVINVDTTVPN